MEEPMAKSVIPDAVDVLRFFETGSLETVEVLFSIVSEKMRERLGGANQDRPEQSDSPRKRNAVRKAAGVESADQGPE
jgi:hypothetical protein